MKDEEVVEGFVDRKIREITFICPSCRHRQVIHNWRNTQELICSKCKKKNTDK